MLFKEFYYQLKESFQKVEKWTTKEKFNAFDLSDIPVGTEYNLTGQVEESELDKEQVKKEETKKEQKSE